MSNLSNSSIWNGKASDNYIGVLPPVGKLVPYNYYPRTLYSEISEKGPIDFDSKLIYINSREPYASEFLITKYGPTVHNVLGTNLGSKR